LGIAQNQWLAEIRHPLRRAGFYFVLAYVFIVVSDIHELFEITAGVKPYILIITTVPMVVLMLLSGGFQRTLRWSGAKYWFGFAVWMIVALPFSSWRAESLSLTVLWIRAVLPILFAIAGCVMTFWEFNRLMIVIAAAGAVNVLAGRFFASQTSGRLELPGITISDPNDYAAHLILVLPFLLLVIVDSRRSKVVRALASGLALYGLYLILSTGSRGGLLAVGAAVLFCLWKLSPRQRMSAAVVVTILACTAIAVTPQPALLRFSTILSRNADADIGGANESADARSHLLRQSILMTFTHPVFGVGMGQFQNYEGKTSREKGEQGYWHETHNSFTQVSSEIGIPALLFYIAGIVSTYRILNRLYGQALRRPRTLEAQTIAITAFCLMLSLIGFCTASFFLSLAYRFYLLALTGLTISFARAAHQNWESAAAPASSDSVCAYVGSK
jgi:O-antigen ligase